MTSASPPVLEATGLHKTFPPATVALSGVDLRLEHGRVHGLLGVNGAGKSTLIKIIAGIERADAGSLVLEGRPVPLPDSPQQAHALGIGVVHQELPLLPNLTAAENAFLGTQSSRFFAPSRRREIERRYTEAARNLSGAPPADRRLSELGPDKWQIVAIVRALVAGARILILDEPTSSLGQRERSALHRVLRELRDMGMGILYVSHFLDDVLDVCDVVSVMRDARVALHASSTDLDADALLRAMTGEGAAPPVAKRAAAATAVQVDSGGRLELRDLRIGEVGPVSLLVEPGERVGLYGLADCGARELLEGLFGLRRHDGTAFLGGKPLGGGPRRRIDQGLGYMPPARAKALIGSWTLAANITLPSIGAGFPYARLQRAAERERGAAAIDSFGIVGTPTQRVRTLSGGNQQKVALAKWMARGVRCLLADEPTRGVDIRGRRMIYELLMGFADGGVPILMFSTDPEELAALCHRVLILEAGQVTHELRGEGISVDALEELGRVRTAEHGLEEAPHA